MKILGIIPARYASTRFPAKPLTDIGGKTMIQRVYEQATKCKALDKVLVATDHIEIAKAVKSFEGNVTMTSDHHQSGTDRCYEALSNQDKVYDYVVNIQGDEPFINPKQIAELTHLLDGNTQLATLAKLIDKEDDLFSSNVVKAIFDKNQKAIYFSRSPIPFNRNNEKSQWHKADNYYKHIGIYAYRTDILEKITKLPVSRLEKAESLEQLRWIENGFSIKIATTEYQSIGIDTPEDLEKVKDFY
ncbi:3-deoxy-manno-octulosonate cytidylyltransferase [Fulvivirga sp. RKSG066]|uniref:3-deoxy-manno-octulosonate cytidylyltransferase n=1 Tax=Fulvivirga aurantia TaxID=2529383 RepID=UPI0012BCC6FF|nr:3-deoxy-manno-octulosonate cytidylyltransferase [Fulvivirga aurantia]MTI20571.1 3-deoxy-manno-octulosonate cytidylyltransferase [Fulvivirga aurantia]